MTFQYVMDFFDKYKGFRKYMKALNLSAHSFYEGNAGFVDEVLFDFLIKFEKAGHMRDTMIQIYSDHGDHVHTLFQYSNSGMSEKLHPPFFIIMPGDIAEVYHDNLVANEQKLISHYEIFETNRRYTKVPKPNNPKLNPFVKAYSVMEEVLPSGRTCADFPMENKNVCQCRHVW